MPEKQEATLGGPSQTGRWARALLHGVPATLATPGAHVVLSSRGREGSLTGCSLRVVAHEALPRSCCFTEAKHVEEPHFFQMELNLVQILFQEHKAQRTGVCLPATQHPETGQMGCGRPVDGVELRK